MNCAEWEERVAAGDPEAANHAAGCPACGAFADGLARDARLLRMLPAEALTVDYGAIRSAARRQSAGRRRRPMVWAAVAAAVLFALRLPWHPDVPRPAAPLPPAPATVAYAVPPQPRVPPVMPRHRTQPEDLDRRFAEFLRAQYEIRHHSTSTPIATGNPAVTILLLEESKGSLQ
jgi:hypothetical protein